jgi:hypothetical protein
VLILLCSAYAAAAGQDHLSFEDRSIASRPAQQWCKDAERIKADPLVDPAFKQKFIEAARKNGCYGPVERRSAKSLYKGWCAEAMSFLNDPKTSRFEKLAILKTMNSRGCLDPLPSPAKLSPAKPPCDARHCI